MSQSSLGGFQDISIMYDMIYSYCHEVEPVKSILAHCQTAEYKLTNMPGRQSWGKLSIFCPFLTEANATSDCMCDEGVYQYFFDDSCHHNSGSEVQLYCYSWCRVQGTLTLFLTKAQVHLEKVTKEHMLVLFPETSWYIIFDMTQQVWSYTVVGKICMCLGTLP